MSKIHYVIYSCYDGTERYYYGCSDESKSLLGPRLSAANIFDTHKSAQKIVARLPTRWRAEPRTITGKKLFQARLKGI